MDPKEILIEITSGNSTRLYMGLLNICWTANKDALSNLYKNKDIILSHIENSDLNKPDLVKRAFRVLENNEAGRCRCNIYEKDILSDPENEEKEEVIRIDKEIKFHELYETHYNVTCLRCMRRYFVKKIGGGHRPIWEWKTS